MAQTNTPVSSPPVTSASGSIAGDSNYDSISAEGNTWPAGWGVGEDNEISIMRILWDLYDPSGETRTITAGGHGFTLTDQVELGVDGIYDLVSGLGPDASLHKMWSELGVNALVGQQLPKAVQYSDILEINGASPTDVTVAGPGGTVSAGNLEWRKTDPNNANTTTPLVFQARIPATNSGALTFNQVGFLILDMNHNVVADSGLIDVGGTSSNGTVVAQVGASNVVAITPSTIFQSNLDALSVGHYRVTVYGAWRGRMTIAGLEVPLGAMDTGKYFAMFRTFTIQP